MPRQQSQEFVITNRLRSLVFVLLFAELFLLAVWLIPAPWNAIVIAAVVVTTFIATLVSRVRNDLEKQINDRIQLKRDGVEYSSGIFGDSWLRPYNEFRVECTPKTLL